MACNLQVLIGNKYSGLKYKYKYKYKYFKFVLEYNSSTSTSTKYYISAKHGMHFRQCPSLMAINGICNKFPM